MSIRNFASAAAVAGAVVVASAMAVTAQGPAMTMEAPTKAVAVLIPTKTGGSIAGTITFTKTDKGNSRPRRADRRPGRQARVPRPRVVGDAVFPRRQGRRQPLRPQADEEARRPGSKTEPRHLGDLGNITADESWQGHLRP